MHQRSQLLEQVTAKRRRLSDGDAVGTCHLHLGIGPGGGGHFTMAVVGQAQGGITKQRPLVVVRLGAVLEVALEGLAEGAGGLFMQGRQTIDGLFRCINDYKRLAHAGLPVF